MSLFRKKPVVISAERLTKPAVIQTLEGDMQAGRGDWLIKGVRGEFYPCKDDIFRQTYEPVDNDGVQALVVVLPEEMNECVCLPFPGVNTVELA